MANSWAVHGIGLGEQSSFGATGLHSEQMLQRKNASADDEVRLKQANAGSDEVMFHKNLFRVSASASKALMWPSMLQCLKQCGVDIWEVLVCIINRALRRVCTGQVLNRNVHLADVAEFAVLEGLGEA
jgi:hypothetical protein